MKNDITLGGARARHFADWKAAGLPDRPKQGRWECRRTSFSEERMANPGQPTTSLRATGDAVKRLEPALLRTPDLGLTVDEIFRPQLATPVHPLHQAPGSTADASVRPAPSPALPDARTR